MVKRTRISWKRLVCRDRDGSVDREWAEVKSSPKKDTVNGAPSIYRNVDTCVNVLA